ncbi:MAG: ATP-binding protein [Clostridia bacterium]|nr:ATP-binding protein [Clostridia bacterium]
MLISLKLNNCFIYNNEVEFSMRANMHHKRFKSNLTSFGQIHVLKTAMLIGPNNAGKTNFIRCLAAIRDMMLNRSGIRMNSNLFSDNPIAEFEVVFLSEKTEYLFEVKYNAQTNEYVYERFAEVSYDVHKNRKETTWFIKDTVDQVYKCENSELVTVMKVASKNNILIHLIDVEHFEMLEKAKQIIVGFAEKIDIIDMNNIPLKKTIDMLKMSDEKKTKIVNFILNADLSMDDYKYLSDDELKVRIDLPEENVKPQENALNVAAPIMEMLHLASVYKGKIVPSIIFDSTGTKKIAAIASYVIDALENGKILVIDELDNSLHFKLTRAIVALFNNELNAEAQLICTVHDVSLLDCQNLFRKDQIWFAHKDRDNAYLYSLTEFTSEKDGVRGVSDLIDRYRMGVFGALPEPDLFKTLEEVFANG